MRASTQRDLPEQVTAGLGQLPFHTVGKDVHGDGVLEAREQRHKAASDFVDRQLVICKLKEGDGSGAEFCIRYVHHDRSFDLIKTAGIGR